MKNKCASSLLISLSLLPFSCFAARGGSGDKSSLPFFLAIVGAIVLFFVFLILGEAIDGPGKFEDSVIIGFIAAVVLFVGFTLLSRGDDQGWVAIALIAFPIIHRIYKNKK